MKPRHLRNVMLPPPAPPRTFEELAIAFEDLRRELCADRGERFTSEETGLLRSAHLCLHHAAISLWTLQERLEADRAAAGVLALEARCRCGHDRGAHLVAPPHPCEPCTDAGLPHGCPGFALATVETLTDKLPPAPATLADELEGGE